MVEIKGWAGELAQKLEAAFGGRLLFVGYQGSYGRGEATPQSDIDIVTVLDAVTVGDLNHYRALVRAQPGGGLACGFICGREELAAWPRYDLYGLVLDTTPVLGDLRALTPAFTLEDAKEALRVGAANLYHAAAHTYLYAPDPKAALPSLGKAAFFCLRIAALLRDGIYRPSKRELLPVLEGCERQLLALSLEPAALDVEEAYSLLLGWCSNMLACKHGGC